MFHECCEFVVKNGPWIYSITGIFGCSMNLQNNRQGRADEQNWAEPEEEVAENSVPGCKNSDFYASLGRELSVGIGANIDNALKMQDYLSPSLVCGCDWRHLAHSSRPTWHVDHGLVRASLPEKQCNSDFSDRSPALLITRDHHAKWRNESLVRLFSPGGG